MQKHILDRQSPDRDPALDRVVKKAIEKGPHPATLHLQRRSRNENAAQRARHFLRIEKEGNA